MFHSHFCRCHTQFHSIPFRSAAYSRNGAFCLHFRSPLSLNYKMQDFHAPLPLLADANGNTHAKRWNKKNGHTKSKRNKKLKNIKPRLENMRKINIWIMLKLNWFRRVFAFTLLIGCLCSFMCLLDYWDSIHHQSFHWFYSISFRIHNYYFRFDLNLFVLATSTGTIKHIRRISIETIYRRKSNVW